MLYSSMKGLLSPNPIVSMKPSCITPAHIKSIRTPTDLIFSITHLAICDLILFHEPYLLNMTVSF